MTDAAPIAAVPGERGGPPSQPRPNPVARFLGESEGAGGPFALLRLTAGPLSDDQIIGAMDAQLAKLSAHVECNTPQADEVRLAIHAAAAQLLDPRVRAHMIARWGGAADSAGPVPEERRRFPRAGSAHVALEHDAVLTLAMFGGWNGRSLHRLSALAAARGMEPQQLAEALRGLGSGVKRAAPERPVADRPARAPLTRLSSPLPAAPPDPDAPPKRSDPFPEEVDPAARILKFVLLGGAALLLLLMTGLGLVVLVALQPPAVVVTGNPPPPKASIQPPAPTPSPPAVAAGAPAPEVAPDIDLVSRELAASVRELSGDPASAIGRFELAIEGLSAAWTALAPDQLVAAQHQVIEFAYRAAPTGAGARAIEAVASGSAAFGDGSLLGPSRVRAAVWSAGMLNRLTKENDLPSGLEQLIDTRLNAALGARRPAGDRSFEAGAAAAVQAIPALLCRMPEDTSQSETVLETWRRWMDCADHVTKEVGPRDRLLLGGLETLLVDGPDPNVDASAFKVVRLIVARLTWRPGDPSREWLIRWFGDARVSSADLYAVTSALATGSSAENVNATMVVPVMASDSVRAEMRDSYTRAWGLAGGPDRATVMRALMKDAEEALANDDPKRPLSEVLGSAVVLSRLNEAASWIWKGQADQATAILGDLELDVAVSTPSARARQGTPALAQPVRGDRGWAAKYLAARKNIQLRLDLIGRLVDESQLDSVSAELIANEAVRGSPNEVRKAAVDRVLKFGASPLVVNGLLEELPTMPATTSNLSLIETVTICRLPGPMDPGWKMAARRALVERLLQIVASEGELAAIDRQSDLLARSLEGRTRETPRPVSSGGGLATPPPAADISAAILYRQWKSKIDPALPPPSRLPSPDEIERRRGGRLALARGMVQLFEAQQVSGVELMAFVVGTERAADVQKIGAVLDGLVRERQRAGHIFEQIRAGEAATLRLWLIRLGQEPQA